MPQTSRRLCALLLSTLMLGAPPLSHAQEPPPEEQPAGGPPPAEDAPPGEDDEPDPQPDDDDELPDPPKLELREPQLGRGLPGDEEDEQEPPPDELPPASSPQGPGAASPNAPDTSPQAPPQQAPPREPELTEEQRFEQTFKQKSLQEQRRQLEQQRAEAERMRYFIPEASDDAPQLDWYEPTYCMQRPETVRYVHFQCDHDQKRCLVAEDVLFREVKRPDGSRELVPTDRTPEMSGGCDQFVSPEEFALLEERGYELVPARLEVPFGYKRDARGRIFQRSFDLRSRMALGIYYAGTLRGDYTSSLTVETHGTYEHFSRSAKRRYRFRFLNGRVTLNPLEGQATLFEYDFGRVGDEPLFYITELIGEPTRHDVYINLGGGLTVGRLDWRSFADAPDVGFLDLLELRAQWEILQGLGLEDHVQLRIGGGLGTRSWEDEAAGSVYVYPEASVRAVWLTSPRGLFQVTTEGRVRLALESETQMTWTSAVGLATAEWVMITISDQPLSLFVQPEARYLDMPAMDLVQRGQVRVMAGLRLSLFTPPPTDPRLIQRVMASEDLGDY